MSATASTVEYAMEEDGNLLFSLSFPSSCPFPLEGMKALETGEGEEGGTEEGALLERA